MRKTLNLKKLSSGTFPSTLTHTTFSNYGNVWVMSPDKCLKFVTSKSLFIKIGNKAPALCVAMDNVIGVSYNLSDEVGLCTRDGVIHLFDYDMIGEVRRLRLQLPKNVVVNRIHTNPTFDTICALCSDHTVKKFNGKGVCQYSSELPGEVSGIVVDADNMCRILLQSTLLTLNLLNYDVEISPLPCDYTHIGIMWDTTVVLSNSIVTSVFIDGQVVASCGTPVKNFTHMSVGNNEAVFVNGEELSVHSVVIA